MKTPWELASLLVACAVLLAGGAAQAAAPTSVVIYEVDGDARIVFGLALYGDPGRTKYQLGESIEVGVNYEVLYAGNYPGIAETTTFTVVDDAGSLVWARSIDGMGGGWSSAPGGGFGFGATWDLTNTAGESVPPGTYWLGLEFENPTYAFPEDTSRLQEVQILDGTWMFRHAFQELGGEALSVAAGDLDGDCDVDLIFHECEPGDARNVVYWNNGDGTFGAGYSFHEGPVEICNGSLRLGDLDRDGDLDLVESALSPPGEPTALMVYLNDGSGVFDQPTHIAYSGASGGNWDSSQQLALGDVNGDLALDAVASFIASRQTVVFINDGAGNLIQDGVHSSESPQTPALGDLDSDGDLDLVVGQNESAPNLVLFNDGSGNFTDSSQLLGDSYTYSVSLGDLDGDGDLDLIDGNIAAPEVVYWNDGAGAMAQAYTFEEEEGSYTHPVVLGDLDGDGDLDAVTGGTLTWVYENDGQGTLAVWNVPLAGTSAVVGDAVLFDADHDGDLDLAIAGVKNYLYYNVTPLPGQGTEAGDSCPGDDKTPSASVDPCPSGICGGFAISPNCAVMETCGNGSLDVGESCDDGNLEEGDGCDPHCRFERPETSVTETSVTEAQDSNGLFTAKAQLDIATGTCGSGVVEFGEDCDGREGCPADCQPEADPAEVAVVNDLGCSCSLGEQTRHGGASWLGLLAAVSLALGRGPRGRVYAS